MDKTDTPVIRELFIDELAAVSGGGPVEELISQIMPGEVGGIELSKLPGATTMACCEEGNSCCP
jgi:hypothetical protein